MPNRHYWTHQPNRGNTTVSEKQIDLATIADREAKENLAFAESRYSAGVGNIIELTDAELLAATASAQVVTALQLPTGVRDAGSRRWERAQRLIQHRIVIPTGASHSRRECEM
jgi:hypothetical protein